MNVVYRCVWTEYEKGFGNRPDGVTYALTEIGMAMEIKRQEDIGDYECFSRASDHGMAIITDELAKKISDHKGVINMSKDDPGMLGIFHPKDPKANIEMFRKGIAMPLPIQPAVPTTA